MVDPYRSPPENAGPSTELHACSGTGPACGPVAPTAFVEQLLRDQVAWQRKLHRLGALALVVGIAPWLLVLVGIGAEPSTPAPVCEPMPLSQPAPVPEAPVREARSRIVSAWGTMDHASTKRVRATGRANRALLDAFRERDTVVRRVVLTDEEAERMFGDHDLTTRVLPVELPGGERGVKLVKFRASSGFGRLGLQQGDVIVRANGRPLGDPAAALDAYSDASEARHLVLEVLREDKTIVLSVAWESGNAP